LITYKYKSASGVTKDEEKYLYKLRLEGIGLIWDDYKDHRREKTCKVVLAKTSRGNPIAWGLLYYHQTDKEWVFLVYVKAPYRRKGIGTKIYRMIRHEYNIPNEKIRVYRHDIRSVSFFDKLQK
jgi:hypothetical protein